MSRNYRYANRKSHRSCRYNQVIVSKKIHGAYVCLNKLNACIGTTKKNLLEKYLTSITFRWLSMEAWTPETPERAKLKEWVHCRVHEWGKERNCIRDKSNVMQLALHETGTRNKAQRPFLQPWRWWQNLVRLFQTNKIVARTLDDRKLTTANILYTEASFEKASRIVLFCSWLACLQTRASVACSSFSNSTRACFLPLDSKILALMMVPWGERCVVISSTATSDGRLDTWIILVGAQQ